MAREFYGYFDSTENDPRYYLSDEFAEAFRTMGGTGVGRGLGLLPAGGMRVELTPGAAMIHGYTYALSDDSGGAKELALSGSGSADRIDRIILRLDLSPKGRKIGPAVLEGIPGAEPIAPALTNTELIKEISLFQVRVGATVSQIVEGDITDERQNPEVCGRLAPDFLQLSVLDERYAVMITEGDIDSIMDEDREGEEVT